MGRRPFTSDCDFFFNYMLFMWVKKKFSRTNRYKNETLSLQKVVRILALSRKTAGWYPENC